MSSQRLESSLDAGQHKRKTSVASRKLSARMDSEISDAFRLFDKVRNWFALQLQFSSSGEIQFYANIMQKSCAKIEKYQTCFCAWWATLASLASIISAKFARVNYLHFLGLPLGPRWENYKSGNRVSRD